MAMNRCLIKVALAIGSCGLLAPFMPGVTALAQPRSPQPHLGHEQGSGHEPGHRHRLVPPVPKAHVWTNTDKANFSAGSYVPVFEVPQSVILFVNEVNRDIQNVLNKNCKLQAKLWVPNTDANIHITINDEYLNDGSGKHDYTDANRLDATIESKQHELQKMATDTHSQALDLKNMRLEYNRSTPNGKILYLKLKFNDTECMRLSVSTKNPSKDLHISVGHFKSCDGDKMSCLQDVTNDGKLKQYVNNADKFVQPPVSLDTIRIVRAENPTAQYPTYTTFIAKKKR